MVLPALHSWAFALLTACTATGGQHVPTTAAGGASPQARSPHPPTAADPQVTKACLQPHCLEPKQSCPPGDDGSALSPPPLS